MVAVRCGACAGLGVPLEPEEVWPDARFLRGEKRDVCSCTDWAMCVTMGESAIVGLSPVKGGYDICMVL